MYGQGNYAPQFRHGPPPPLQQPPPFHQPPPGPPHSMTHQPPPGPPPPSYQHAPLAPAPPPQQPVHQPPPASVNMGQPYSHLPHPIRGSAPMVHAYAQPIPSYPRQPMPPPPRMLPPPPLPSHSQGQVLYRTPAPPPFGIQHAPAPPPPPVSSSFVSVTPAPFVSYGQAPAVDAYPPSLPPPPPPPPPSSPPPLPPSPPPPVSPMPGFADAVPMEPSGSSAEHDVAGDGEKGGGTSGEGGNLEDKILLTEGKAQVDLSSPPPKPVEEVVRNIEVLCQFMAKVGPHFEDMARTKEAGNPQFDFLFGGDAGSDAAVGHEYFLWMKRKTLCEMESSKKQDQKFLSSTTLKSKDSLEAGDVDDEFAPVSPAVSDMDMEDDMDKRFDKLNEESAGDFASLSREIHITRGPLHESQSTAVRLVSEVAESGTVSCLGPASMPTSEDIKDSSFIEDISPVRASHDAVEHAVDSNVHGSIRTFSGDSSLIKGSPTAASGKSDEIPRFFVKDGSPFRLIQGYASDDSEEDDTKESVEINIPVASPTATTSASGFHQDMSATQASSPSDKRKDDKVPPCNPAQNTDVLEDSSIHTDHQIGNHHQEDTRLDSAMQDVDEFGRLVRKGTSDSDSDQMYPNRRPVKRGRSRSRSRSPQGSRRRRRSRSPRRRDKRSRSRSWSPKRSRSKSPSAFRRTNMFARRDRDQRPDCFNFYRGRCFRGASCRYLHRDFTRHMSRQQQYQDFQDSGKYDGHDAALLSDHETAMVTDMEDEKCEKFLQEEVKNSEVPASMEPSRASIIIANAGGLDEKDAFSTVKNDAGDLQVFEQVSQEVDNMMKTEQENANPVEEERTQVLVESCQLTLADSTAVQPSLAHETQSTRETLLGKPSTSADLSSQDSQSTPHTATLELQNATQLSHAEGSVRPLPAQTTQLAAFQSEAPVAQPYNVHDPATQIHSTQGPIISSYSNYVPPDQPLLPSEFPLHSFSAPQETPPLPPPDHTNAPLVPQQSRENLLLPATGYQSHPPPPHMFPSHRPIDTDYHSHGVPQNPNWSNIPRPPPPSHVHTLPGRPPFPSTEFPLPQHQQNAMPPTSDFNLLRGPYPPGEVGCPQEIVFHPRPFHSVELSHQTAEHMDEFRNRPLPMGNQQNHPFVREDRFSHAAMPAGPQMMFDPQRDYHLRNPSSHPEDAPIPLTGQGFASSNPFVQVGAMQPPPLPNRMQPFSREEFPPPVRDLSYFHHLPYGQQRPNFPSNMGTTSTAESAVQRYSSSFPGNKPPYASDIGLLKMPVSTHYNPFASTFEQSTTSLKFGSGDSGRESDVGYSSKYDSSFPSGHVTVDGHESRAGGYAHQTSAEMLADVQKQAARESVAGDAYDPLFDSIEPSSSAVKKLDRVREQDPVVDNAGTKSKLSSLRRPADVEETSGQKGEPGVERKSEVDEFGEVATDAEAGVVENDSPQLDGKDWSPGVAVDAAAAGEVEIDQVKSPGKNKKSKDSRSMKLFKIALADFVKEVLKPSWRQGNMSKEAFKTIVKKTVDKVSGAMPSHQIPKSQVKINQYVESSQRKLTKLVMGYVDKYVKM